MASVNLTDQTMDEPEQVLWRGNFAARSMCGLWIGGIIVSVLVMVAVLRIDALRGNRMVWLTMWVALIFIWLAIITLMIYRKLSQHYEITNFQLKHRSGLLVRQVNRIEMIDIDDVIYRQGPLQALLNVGTIQLLSSDTSHPSLVMPGIGNVSKVAAMIDTARRNERHKRGIHVEAI